MTRVHVIVRATVELDEGLDDVELDDLYEPVEEGAARGLAAVAGVYEVISCAALEVLDAVDPSWGEGP